MTARPDAAARGAAPPLSFRPAAPRAARSRTAIESSNADFPSGPWTGFYQQHGRQHAQDLDLEFAAGSVAGSGHDEIGAFTVRGSYDAATREVLFRKSYAGSHVVHYRGFREHKGIWGVWEIRGQGRSGFHIWPLHLGANAADAAAQADERERQDAPPAVAPRPQRT